MTVAFCIDTGLPPAPQGTTNDQVPVLMLHGIGGWAESWRPQLDTFSSHARCIAWTMPGYHPSELLAQTTIATLANAVVELLDDLEVERADVIGHSMGGYIAQEFGLAHPERASRLVLAGTTAAFGKPGSSFNESFLAARLEPLEQGRTPADLAADLVEGLVGEAANETVKASARASMTNISPEAYRAALGALVEWNALDRLADLDLETLCIAADEDNTAPVRAMERLHSLLPNATLAVMDASGHLMNLEQPEAFNRLVADFLGFRS